MSVQFQGMVLKIMLDDRDFSSDLASYVQPHYFTNPVHQWMWGTALKFRETYWSFPTLMYLASLADQLPEDRRAIYAATVIQVRDVVVSDEGALRDQLLEFVRLNVFRQAFVDSRDLFNAGDAGKAMDVMGERMDKLRVLTWKGNERSWLSEGFIDRHVKRQSIQSVSSALCTGIPEMDRILDGGLRPGELGIWISYPKTGKTTFLVNLSLVPVRTQFKPGIYFVLEGSRQYIENRFDVLLADEQYSNLKRGEVEPQKWQKAVQEVQFLKRLHVIKDLTLDEDANITHVHSELRDLRQRYGFNPESVVLDYVDLLRSRTKDTEESAIQKKAVKDLKALSARGYAVWTASQVQRPKGEDWRASQEVLLSNKIADCYDKVRIADFVGSLNQTDQEREQGVMRLYAELYRDGPANRLIPITADFSKMQIGGGSGSGPPGANGAVIAQKPLGYGRMKQTRL